MNERLLSYKDAASVLGCSQSKVQKMCLAGEIPIIKIGSHTRIRATALQRWMETQEHYHHAEKCREYTRPDPLPATEATFARSK